MQITRFKTQYLSTTILIVLGVLVSTYVATADMYTDSAHGNNDPPPGYGVNRIGTAYDTGDCAHCHETFDSSVCGLNNYMLFYDDWVTKCDLFCFQCHSWASEYQQVSNYPYCVTFGGRSSFYGTIKTQLCDDDSLPENCGSRHNVKDIQKAIRHPAREWGFSAVPDPCVACHPPHHAQQNHPVAIVGGKLNTAVRLPSHYKNTDAANLLWGDDEGERMSDYASSVGGTYQAPFYGSPGDPPEDGPFEPAGDGTSDGSNLPDYVTFCMDCHQYPQYDADRGDERVRVVWWGVGGGDRHGGYPANDCGSPLQAEGSLREPYIDSANSNYVLSCLDCHEPHGTKKRLHLIRRMINGEEVAELGKDHRGNCEHDDWLPICDRCHIINESHKSDLCCSCCHGHGVKDSSGSGTSCNGKPLF